MKVYYVPPPCRMAESQRNVIHCSAVGCEAGLAGRKQGRGWSILFRVWGKDWVYILETSTIPESHDFNMLHLDWRSLRKPNDYR